MRLGDRRRLGLPAEIGRGDLLVGVDLLLGGNPGVLRLGRLGLLPGLQVIGRGMDDDLLLRPDGRQRFDLQGLGHARHVGGGCRHSGIDRRGCRRGLGQPGGRRNAPIPVLRIAGPYNRRIERLPFGLRLGAALPRGALAFGGQTGLRLGRLPRRPGRPRGQVALQRLDVVVIQARQGRPRVQVQRPRQAQHLATRRLQRLGQLE